MVDKYNRRVPIKRLIIAIMAVCMLGGVSDVSATACPEIWLPVCGTDGNTYGNSCFAGLAGVNILHEGECENQPKQCYSNGDCDGSNEYCAKSPGECETGTGVCTSKPTICYFLYAPVCGCDGVTYSNDCIAAGAGVNILHDGECENKHVMIGDDLTMSIPCAELNGTKLKFNLNYFDEFSWQLDADTVTKAITDKCLMFDEGFNLSVDCAEYENSRYGFTMYYDGMLFWEMGIDSVRLMQSGICN